MEAYRLGGVAPKRVAQVPDFAVKVFGGAGSAGTGAIHQCGNAGRSLGAELKLPINLTPPCAPVEAPAAKVRPVTSAGLGRASAPRFMSPAGSFKSLRDVINDRVIESADQSMIPTSMTRPAPKRHRVYNFTVEGLHTYIAGGYRVHNDSRFSPQSPEGKLGSLLGSTLAAHFGPDNVALNLLTQAAGDTIGGYIGDAIGHPQGVNADYLPKRFGVALAKQAINYGVSQLNSAINEKLGFDQSTFGGRLGNVAVNTVVGTAVNYAGATLALKAIDITDKVARETVGAIFGAEIKIVEEGGQVVSASVDFGSMLQSAGLSALGSFAGSELAKLLFDGNPQGQAIGGSLGAGVASFIGAKLVAAKLIGGLLAGPVGIVVFAFVGAFLGTAIGGLFGGDSVGPNAVSYLRYNDGKWELGAEGSDNGADIEVARAMSRSARDTLTLLFDNVGGIPLGKFDRGPENSLAFGFIGGKYYSGAPRPDKDEGTFDTPQEAIEEGVLRGITAADFEGGDRYIKRAFKVTTANTLKKLGRDLELASAYGVYADNKVLYDKVQEQQLENAITNNEETLFGRNGQNEQEIREELEAGLRQIAGEIQEGDGTAEEPLVGLDTLGDQAKGEPKILVDGLFGGDGDDSLIGGKGTDVLVGGQGDDVLIGDHIAGDGTSSYGDADILYGAQGDDLLKGGKGDDVYFFGRGDGSDTLHDDYHYWGTEKYVYNTTQELEIRGGEGEKRRIQLVNGKYFVPAGGEENARWVDASTVTHGEIIDIHHYKKRPVIKQGDGGDDTIEFANGISLADIRLKLDGNQLIIALDDPSATSFAELSDRITITDWTNEKNRIEKLGFSSGATIDISGANLADLSDEEGVSLSAISGAPNDLSGTSGEDVLISSAANEVLSGGAGNDVYYYDATGGQDTILDSAGSDILEFGAGVTAKYLLMEASGNDLIVTIRTKEQFDGTDPESSTDIITLKDWITASKRIERFRFADGTVLMPAMVDSVVAELQTEAQMEWRNTLAQAEGLGLHNVNDSDNVIGKRVALIARNGSAGANVSTSTGDDILHAETSGGQTLMGGKGQDVLFGSAGDDSLLGGGGNDAYYFGRGSGVDEVWDQTKVKATVQVDQPIFTWVERVQGGEEYHDVHYEYRPKDQKFRYTTPDSGGENSTHSVWLPTAGRNGRIEQHENLVDVDTLVEGDAGSDSLKFGVGISAGDLVFEVSGNNLIVGVRGPADAAVSTASLLEDRIVIKDWFTAFNRVEFVRFEDGSSYQINNDAGTISLAADADAFEAVGNVVDGQANGGILDDGGASISRASRSFVVDRDSFPTSTTTSWYRDGLRISATEGDLVLNADVLTGSDSIDRLALGDGSNGSSGLNIELGLQGADSVALELMDFEPTDTANWTAYNAAGEEIGTGTISHGDLVMGEDGLQSYTIALPPAANGAAPELIASVTLTPTDHGGGTVDNFSLRSASVHRNMFAGDLVAFDLDGNGLDLISRSASAALFDMDGDGYLEQTGWIGGGDAFLVWDRPEGNTGVGNGLIDNLSEMFTFSGEEKEGGPATLASLDSNQDGKFSSLDDHFEDVVLWNDANGDGQTDIGEILPFHRLGITAIDLSGQVESYTARGNEILSSGFYTRLGEVDKQHGRFFGVSLSHNDLGVKVEEGDNGTGRLDFEGRKTVSFGSGLDAIDGTIDASVAHTVTGTGLDDALTVDATTDSAEDGVQFNGEAGDDTLTGGKGNDVLIGGAGKDTLLGGAGDDILIMDDEDTLTRVEDSVTKLNISGGDSDDAANPDFDLLVYDGSNALNLTLSDHKVEAVFGGSGDDVLDAADFAAEQETVLAGREGNDTLTGGAGDDNLEGGEGDDTLIGNAGNDVLTGGAGSDSFSGGVGDDQIYIDAADQQAHIRGGAGKDTVIVNDTVGVTLDLGVMEAEAVIGGFGDDTLSAGSVIGATLFGGSGNDTLTGGDGDDTMDGGAGFDTVVYGGGEEDYQIIHGTGDDAGLVTITGTDGADVLSNIERVVFANGQEDLVALESVVLISAPDDWAIVSQNGRNALLMNAYTIDQLDVRRDVDDLVVGVREPGVAFESLTVTGRLVDWFNRMGDVSHFALKDGASFHMALVAETGDAEQVADANWLTDTDYVDLGLKGGLTKTGGDAVADTLVGSSGDDTLIGLDGADRLEGGAGRDSLVGGRGDDTYFFGRGDGLDNVYDAYTTDDVHTTRQENYTYYTYVDWYRSYTGGEGGGSYTWVQPVSAGLPGGGEGHNISIKERRFKHTGSRDVPIVIPGVAADGGQDTLEFGEGITATDLVARVAGNDLVIGLRDSLAPDTPFDQLADKITLKDWFDDFTKIETLRFKDGDGFKDYKLLANESGSGDHAEVIIVSVTGGVADGGLGDDVLIGSTADVTLRGGDGVDTLIGGDGNDLLEGGAGNDTLIGGAGDDTLFGGAGDDTLFGGAGSDTALFSGNLADYQVAYDQDTRTFTVSQSTASGNNDTLVSGVEQIEFDDITLNSSHEDGIAPIAIDGDADVIDEGGLVSWSVSARTYDGSSLNDVTYGLETGPQNGVVVVNADGTYVYKANDGYSGADSFTFNVTNEKGLSSTATVSLDVRNQAGPTITAVPGDVLVNDGYTTGDQRRSDVAALSDGGYIVVWSTDKGTGDSWDVYGQRYDASGAKVDGEFIVNSLRTDLQAYPSVAAFADGGFIVSFASHAQEGNGAHNIYTRRYLPDATNSAEFVAEAVKYVSDQSGLEQVFSTIDTTADGGYVVTWTLTTTGNNEDEVYKKVFDADGVEVSGTYGRIHGPNSGDQRTGGVAVLKDGETVLAYSSKNTGEWGIYTTRLYNDGTVRNSNITVQAGNNDWKYKSSMVTALEGGGYAIAFLQIQKSNTSKRQVYVYVFDENGVKQAGLIPNQSGAASNVSMNDIVGLADGGFVVTYTKGDGNGSGTFARRYDKNRVAVGDEIALNDFITGDQWVSKVAALASGGFVVIWESVGQDGSGYGVYSKIFQAGDDLTGDLGNNVIAGTSGYDTLNGGAGDDKLIGGASADTLDGGAGWDTASYESSELGVMVNLATGATSGSDAEGDVLIGIENLIGSAFTDDLTGDAGANRLQGGDGSDILTGGAGADTLDGGTAEDTASYAGSPEEGEAGSGKGVTVNLETGDASGGDAEGDTLIDIENLQGSAFDDTLIGDAQDNQLIGNAGADILSGGEGDDNLLGGAGNDQLSGGDGDDTLLGGADNDVMAGGAGADSLDGGLGDDTASYVGSDAAVSIDLTAGTASGGDAEGDVLTAIESLTGSGFDDHLTGDANANTLMGEAGADNLLGGDGNDELSGGAGNDILSGGDGDDVLKGGDGDDIAVFSGNKADFTITTDAAAGTITVTDTVGAGGSDTISRIETLQFDDDPNVSTSAYNWAPVLANLIDDQVAQAGETYSFQVPVDSFRDDNAGDVLTFTATLGDGSALPGWLSFDPVTQTFSGTPPVGDIGTSLTIKVVASDADGATADDEFTVEVMEALADPTLSVTAAQGNEDNEIALAVTAGLPAGVSDGILSVVFLDVPDGALLSAGTKNADGTWTLSLAELTGLTITPATDSGADFNLSVRAELTDGLRSSQMTAQLAVTVNPIADVPTVTVSDAAGDQGSAIALNVEAVSTDNDGSEVVSVTISGVPAGATLSAGTDNNDGSWTLTAAQLNDLTITSAGTAADFQLMVTATSTDGADTAPSQVQTIDVTVNAITPPVVLPGTPGNDTLTGGAGNDTLSGGDGDDTLFGGDGNDTLDGGEGTDHHFGGAGDDLILANYGADDVFHGGAGNDTIDFSYSTEAANFDLSNELVTFNSGSLETFTGFENLIGTKGANTITGDAGGNVLRGHDGNDVLHGNGGNDLLDGGQGNDTLIGGAGDDTLIGAGGADTFDGGAGNDTVDFTYSTSDADFSLVTNDVAFAAGATETFTSIENVVGTQGVNVITGSAGANVLDGYSGNDTINAGDGSDTLIGGTGNDSLDGGAGDDVAVFSGNRADYTVTVDQASGETTVVDNNTADGDDGTDSLNGVETLRFADQDVTVSGSDGGSGGGNTAPVLSTAIANQTASEDQAFSFQVPAGSFTDADAGDTLSFSATLVNGSALPAWLSFDPATRTFSGTPGNGDVGTLSVKVVVNDGTETAEDSFDISIANTLDVPSLSVSDAAGDENTAISLDVTAAVTAVDASETLSVVITGVPAGATLSAGTDNGNGSWTLSVAQLAGLTITPATGDTTGFQLTVTATSSDGSGAAAAPSQFINVTVNAVIAGQILVGTGGSDILTGGSGNDTLSGYGGSDTLLGHGGDDTLNGGSAADTLDGGDGNDVLILGNDVQSYEWNAVQGGLGQDTILGGSGDDIFRVVGLSAANSIETIDGGAGHDVLQAYGTGDIDLTGVSLLGVEVIATGSGGGDVTGTSGADTIKGSSGSDSLFGAAGDDTFLASNNSTNSDTFKGGDGNDQILGTAGDNTIAVRYLSATNSIETIDGGAGHDRIVGSVYADNIDLSTITVTGIEEIDGGGNKDTIVGSAGADFVKGGSGSDTLTGGGGNDTLQGDAGNDTLEGGAGDDTYVFGLNGGQDLIRNNDAVSTNDRLLFGGGISSGEVWFEHTGDNLVVSVLGTTDEVVFENWFTDPARTVDKMVTNDGQVLLQSQVDQLVTAMASFTPSDGAGTGDVTSSTLPTSVSNAIAASWQSGT